MTAYVIERGDGGVSIMHTTGDVQTEISKWERASNTTAVSVRQAGALPDRTFRNAWKVNGAAVEIDMAKARDIHRDRLRLERGPLLEALDVEVLRAVETDDRAKIADIAAQKKALRDATEDPAIEAARTPEELKAIALPDLGITGVTAFARPG